MEHKNNFMYIWAIIGVCLIIFTIGYLRIHTKSVQIDITSFEECVKAGYPVLESYPEQCRTPFATFTRDISPQVASFSEPITFLVGEQITFTDGLQVTLTEINDSRCAEEVVCIWAGELSPLLRITGGDAGKSLKEIRLGTERIKSVTENGYTFTLNSSTEAIAMITVAKEESDQVVCTQEAKMCPDGSYVGRTGLHCEFAECPTH